MSLESVFINSCDKHEHLKLLESQWRFDKELISKALQNVGEIFPHYSRHDSSHSRQIIVNIERILGDKINHLTATDMWLLLEAAYSHDIGMVITHKQIQDLDTYEFRSFIQEISEDQNHPLQLFSKNWINDRATLPNGSNAHVFFNEYRQLISEWYRKKHPENSAKIVVDPVTEIGLSSPRNELLPKRLFGALSAICNAHGQSFDEVMKLPFSEAGMATEDCHPRYIAFLLRMGDLLDIDDNRFCPVMMKISGEKLPAESHSHFEKHRSIKHFRLDSERIQIEAVCPSPESYEIAHDWFKWLEKEYHSQSQHWLKIVPSKKLGRLPTLSPPKVTLAKPYLIISEGKRPSFDLNHESIIKLLRSTGLYTSKLDSIREILQNAVDSTIVAIWNQHSETIKNLNPSSSKLFQIYDEYKLEVDFIKHPKNSELYTLSVKDHGIGISKDDLIHMLKIGNSSKNNKSKLIQNMPDWFKPSGNFGIGLQSIYLLSDKFTISTKSRFSNEEFLLTFNSGKGSSVIIEQITHGTSSYGATVTVDVKLDDFPESLSIPRGNEGRLLLNKLNDYDFTLPNSDLKSYEKSKIINEIIKFNSGSPIKIKVTNDSLPAERSVDFFSVNNNTILTDISFHYHDNLQNRTLFRGQEFSGLHPHTDLIHFTIDFYGHQAMDFLTYNREKILPEARKHAHKEITQTLLEYIDNKYQSISEDKRPCAAAFYFKHSDIDNEKYIDDLSKFKIKFLNRPKNDYALKDILDSIYSGEIKFITKLPPPTGKKIKDKVSIETDNDLWIIPYGESADTALYLIDLLATKNNYYWQKISYEGLNEIRQWSNIDIQPVSDEILKKILSPGKVGFFEIGKRILFPSWCKYRKLSIKALLPWPRIYNYESHYNDYMVLPYTFDTEGNRSEGDWENLIEWVFMNRKNPEVTRDEIDQLYKELKVYLETLL